MTTPRTPDKPVRLSVTTPGGTLWSEPLCWVDAATLARVFTNRGDQVDIVPNTAPRHRELEQLWAKTPAHECCGMTWCLGCTRCKCANEAATCRLFLVRKKPAVLELPPAIAAANPTQPNGAYQAFVVHVIKKLAAALGIPGGMMEPRDHA